MMRTEKDPQRGPDPASDRSLWQRCRTIDAPEDEAAQFLDFAAFADRLLDPDERDRVAARLADDPEAAADVDAARRMTAADRSYAGLDRVIERACSLLPEVEPESGQVVSLAGWRSRRLVQSLAQWGSIAAALAVASWLGFAMGTDTTAALTQFRPASDSGLIPELFDPASGFLRDLGDGLRT